MNNVPSTGPQEITLVAGWSIPPSAYQRPATVDSGDQSSCRRAHSLGKWVWELARGFLLGVDERNSVEIVAIVIPSPHDQYFTEAWKENQRRQGCGECCMTHSDAIKYCQVSDTPHWEREIYWGTVVLQFLLLNPYEFHFQLIIMPFVEISIICNCIII